MSSLMGRPLTIGNLMGDPIKGVCHEIFYLCFYLDSNPSMTRIYRLKCFFMLLYFKTVHLQYDS